MSRSSLRAAALLAAVFAAPLLASGLAAQKALVVCPPADAAGCDRVAQQLALATTTGSTLAFPGGVDKRYTELRTMTLAQLQQYAAVFVPSLANAPYDLLREPGVQTRLAQVLTGRVAVWSGTPDRGTISGTSAGKLTLIQNLGRWAAGQWGDGLTGLVVLQDFSDLRPDGTSPRYDWVQGISGAQVGPDLAVRSYDQVEKNAANPAASAIVGSLAYTNMASFGLSSPAPGGLVGAWGQTVQAKKLVRGQIVLETFTRPAPSSAVVGSAGGTFPFVGGKVVMGFPAGALAEDWRISVSPATVSAAGYVANTAYSFGPSGLTFALPVSLTISYDDANLPPGANEANLVICEFKASAWSEVPGSSVNTTVNTVTAPISHFSRYAVFTEGSCGGDTGGGGGGGGGGKPVGSVAVAPPSASVAAKGSQLLTATVLDKQNNPLPGIAVTWSSTNGGSFTTTTGTTNASGQATTTFTVDSVAGVAHVVTAAASNKSGTSTLTVVAGAAAKLAFTQQPTSTAAGSAITPAVQVAIRDAYGNTVTGATDNVTVAIGTNPSGGTLSGTATVAAVNGIANFADLGIDKVGSGYTLTAAASGLTGATSSAFDVTAGAAAKLVFAQQPTNTTAGAAIAPAVTVEVQDALGNVVSGATNSITLAIGTNPSGGTLSGTATVAAVNGVATFSDLSIDKTGTGYTLAASSSGLTGATSSAFDVAPGAATKLAFTVQPSNTSAGASITPAVQVTVQDAAGNTVTGASSSITLAIGTNPSGGTLSGTATVAAVNGVATFSDLSIDRAGTGYTLTASASGLTGATSGAFDVTAGAAAQLAFTVQPTNTTAGQAITPAVQVEIRDALGNPVATATDNVTVAIGANPSGGTLSGTTTVAAVNGVATFSTLSIDKAGTGYTLAASSGSLTGATSSAFDVAVGAPATVVVAPARDTIPAGGTAGFTATVTDAFGNTIPSPTVGWSSSNPAAATVSPATGTSTTATGASPLAADDSTQIVATSGSASGSAVLLVLAVSPPDAKDDAFTVNAGSNLSGSLFADSGSGADNLGQPAATLTSFGGGSLGGTVTSNAAGAGVALAGGTLTVNADGTFSLNGATTGGTFTFQYRLTNSQGTDDATVTIVVRRAPDAKDDAFTVSPGATLNGDLTADNGSGADDLGSPAATVASFGGGSLGGTATSNAAGASVSLAGGTLTVNANGSFSLANPTTTGTYTFQYRLTNAAGSDDATATIVVQRAPDAKDDAFTTVVSTTLNGDLTADNGGGADDLGDPAGTLTSFGGGSLGGTVTSNAAGAGVALAGGMLTVNANGTFSLANPTTAGTYTFQYRLTNAAGTDDATVTIVVQRGPDAKDDSFTMLPGATLNGDLTANNGSGADDLGSPAATVAGFGGGSLGGTATSNAAGASVALAGGTLTVNANGTFSLASPTTAGTYTFQYRLANAAGSDDATVTIVVQRPPDAKDDAFTTTTGSTLNGNVTADNGGGADDLGDPAGTLTHFGGGSLGGTVGSSAAGASVPLAGGTLTVNANGTFSLANPTTGGVYTFLYRLTNPAGTDSATVTLTVQAPPVAVADSAASASAPGSAFHTALDATLVAPAGSTPGLLANDILGFPAATLTHFGGGTLGGTVTNAAGSNVVVDGHSLTVNADGSFTYTPKTGFTGYFTFQYRIANGAGSSEATVKIAVGVRPTATSSTYTPTLVGNVPINTTTSTGFTVTAAGDQPTYDVTGATGGVAVIHTDRTFEFTPSAGFTGAASFTFTVTNGFGTSSVATVSLTVGTPVWFVDAAAGAGGDGRKGTPFNCLVGASGCYNGSANLAGHVVYVASGTYSGTGALVLKNTQRLIGQGAAGVFATLAGLTWPADAGAQPATGGAAPTLASASGNGITLGSGNVLRGFVAGGAPGAAIAGSTVGTLTVADVSINNGSGRALDLTTSGTLDAAFGSISATGGTGNGINLVNQAGTLTSGTTSITNPSGTGIHVQGSGGFSFGTTTVGKGGSSGTGVHLQTNSGTTTFGSLAITTSSGTGLFASSAGTLSIGGGTVSATGGPAVDATSTTFSGAGFSSTSSSGSTGRGISLTSVSGTVNLGSGSIATAAAEDFLVSGGTDAINYAGSITNTANRSVSISGRTGGTVTLSGSISDTGTGILVQNGTGGTIAFSGATKVLSTGASAAVTLSSNTGATISFVDSLRITTTSGAGFSATGGGTVTVTGANNSITSTTGTALNVANTTIGASGLTFRSISANGGVNGIVLNNTGSSGGLVVAGNGGSCSIATPTCTGGLIQNTTG
ncbi:MAG TPA: Ig-like domain-containing protein, partial [Longimicrobium sp.]